MTPAERELLLATSAALQFVMKQQKLDDGYLRGLVAAHHGVWQERTAREYTSSELGLG